MATIGRPTLYSEELAGEICARLADGQSLKEICKSDDMPARSTVFSWLAAHKTFTDMYMRAREVQADALFDEIVAIADDGSNDYMERLNDAGEGVGWQENGEALRRSALRVDARKWVVAKLLPRKYSEKHTTILEGGDKPVGVDVKLSPIEAARQVAFALRMGVEAAKTQSEDT